MITFERARLRTVRAVALLVVPAMVVLAACSTEIGPGNWSEQDGPGSLVLDADGQASFESIRVWDSAASCDDEPYYFSGTARWQASSASVYLWLDEPWEHPSSPQVRAVNHVLVATGPLYDPGRTLSIGYCDAESSKHALVRD